MSDESFSRLVKRHRVAAGLSQEMLAERAGVSVDAISALERGTRHAPYKSTLDLLIAALALDGDARDEIEEAAKLARVRGPLAQRRELLRNLPPQLTSFVDREKVLAEIEDLLRSHRLVTLAGAGGAGKTRTAIRVASEMLDEFEHGVWLAELAPISEPSLVADAIARVLKLQELPNRPILETLLNYLKRKHLLLVLDNCEHVIEEARQVVAPILQGCPDVRILATSRESLTIAGERVYQIPPLPVPLTTELLSTEELLHYGAVQLFTDRALSADNRFTVSVDSAPHIAEVCRRLDGIPLAIELAAARVNVLSPKQLAQRLDERFRLLTAADRSALPRHRTMRALIDWSYDLLSDDERRLFRKLSIFARDFALEMVVSVCSDETTDEMAVLDLLSSLVDKSLVQTEPSESGPRYRLLESTGEYAREKLVEAGEYDAAARAHARAFLTMAEQLNDAWETTADRAWFAQAKPELENFRAALTWALIGRGNEPLGQRLTSALKWMWQALFPTEGRRWVRVAQELTDAETPPAVIAGLELTEASLAKACIQYKAALTSAECALSEYRALDDPLGIVEAKRQLGDALVRIGKISEGEELLRESLMGARSLGARKSVSSTLGMLGNARAIANDWAAARQLFGEALTGARAAGAELSAAIAALNLAETEFWAGDVDASLRLTREALTALSALHDIRTVTDRLILINEAAYLVALRRYDEARVSARDAIAAALDVQYSVGLALALQHLAAIGALRPNTDAQEPEDRRRAARVLGYVDARIEVLEALREYTEQHEYDAMLGALRDALSEDELSALMQEGSIWSEDQAVAEAMLI